ncbi:MAG: hypothetical protein NC124_17305, partial [Clostridium sp.]|nr:hypothetical protein [Clostridium sp.]
MLRNRESGQETRIYNQFYSSYYSLQNIEFADGTAWGLEDLKDMTYMVRGTEGDDSLGGFGSTYGY